MGSNHMHDGMIVPKLSLWKAAQRVCVTSCYTSILQQTKMVTQTTVPIQIYISLKVPSTSHKIIASDTLYRIPK